ncbi:hypothetical protein [Chondromyces crocatus]|uniref:Uncharacterized protein n=1 Tax=Chondromyces crocatus TaxID=52 RepID=A0A0K1ESB1_CHOCO|nr:hypothetical protein [Chondromyces crocatus]AKT43820.1 uncharacterized protein CMC5_080570 [Chondromyces crocatus]
MARSRSSFDLDQAVIAATALVADVAAKPEPHRFGAVPLVSFSIDEANARAPSTPPSSLQGVSRLGTPSDLPPSSTAAMSSGPSLRSALPPSVRGDDPDLPSSRGLPSTRGLASRAAMPPPAPGAIREEPDPRAAVVPPVATAAVQMAPLPDLSAIQSPLLRCEQVIAWIARVAHATDVFLADAAGLPVTGSAHDETRLAASGWIAAAATALAKSLPGAPSGAFELHLGEGPFFQLIGFQVRGSGYVIGMICPTPLSPRQAGAIRLACIQALGDVLGGSV